MEYRKIMMNEMNLDLFLSFERYQEVTKCCRKIDGQWAKDQGASKLYISAHSAAESQRFYESMGCVEAVEYNEEHVKKEPCDCQLEYVL